MTASTTAPIEAVPCAARTTTTAIPATNAPAKTSHPAAPSRPPATAARAVPENTRLLTTRASVIGASAGICPVSFPWARARSSSTFGSSRCAMPAGPDTAAISRASVL